MMTDLNLSILENPYVEDYNLAQQAGDGDLTAQRVLIDKIIEKVRVTVWYLVKGNDEFDDMVQNSLIEILKSVKSFKGNSKLETWCVRITIRTSMRYLKKNKRWKKFFIFGSLKEGSTLSSGEKICVNNELQEKLKLHLQKLKPQRRVVVVLRFVYNYSIKEISKITESPENTVRDRLKIGKKNLINHIKNDPSMRDFMKG
jgi:RNA polymerase sigma-70 factor, ECF subfamily